MEKERRRGAKPTEKTTQAKRRNRIIGAAAAGSALVLGVGAITSQIINKGSGTENCLMPSPTSDVRGLKDREIVKLARESIHFSPDQRADEQTLWGLT